MPELPEAEKCKRDLEKWLRVGISKVHVYDPAVLRHRLSSAPRDAAGSDAVARLERLGESAPWTFSRHGKRIGMRGTDHAYLIHLGMSGQFSRSQARPEGKSLRLVWALSDGSYAAFDDPRRFGCLVEVEPDSLDEALRNGMGPDGLADLTAVMDGLRGKRVVKVALMDQKIVAGLGNIHVAEALWRAGVHPQTRCDALTAEQRSRIGEAVHEQLQDTIDEIVAGELVYISRGGENTFKVYGRAGEPCFRCSTPIEKIVQGGRSTFFCPQCQKE